MEESLLRKQEACERLGISRAQLDRLIHDGQLRSVKLGRLRRIPSSAIDEFISDLRAAT